MLLLYQINPPYHCPMVEIVPSPWTSKATQEEAREIMKYIGQHPGNEDTTETQQQP